MYKFSFALLLILFALLLAVSVMAQDSAPPVVPVPVGPPPVDSGDTLPALPDNPGNAFLDSVMTFFNGLVEQLEKLTYVPELAAGVIIFTALAKAVLAVVKIEVKGGFAVLLALGVQIMVWSVYQLSVSKGFDLRFVQWYDALTAVVQSILPLFGLFLASHAAYEKFSSNPVIGYRGYRKPA